MAGRVDELLGRSGPTASVGQTKPAGSARARGLLGLDPVLGGCGSRGTFGRALVLGRVRGLGHAALAERGRGHLEHGLADEDVGERAVGGDLAARVALALDVLGPEPPDALDEAL